MTKAAQNAGLISQDLGIEEATQQMFKLQEQGKLISSQVLPEFAKALRASAAKGLEKALESNRVAMNRLVFAAQEAADLFFRSGYGDGLTDFFNTSAEFLRDNADLWKALGQIVGSVLKGVSLIIKGISPIIESVGFILRNVTDALDDFSGVMAALVSPTVLVGLGTMVTKFGSMVPLLGKMMAPMKALLVMATRFAAPFLIAVGAIEEIINLFTREKRGLLYDPTDPNSKQIDRVMKMFGLAEDKPTTAPDTNSFMGRLQNVGEAVIKGSPTERLTALKDFWVGNFNQVVQVVVDGEVIGEAAINSESGQEGVKRVMRNEVLPNY